MKWYDNPKIILPIAFVAVTGCFMRSCVSEAHAQTTVTFKLLPPGHDGQVQGVGRARYFLLDEYLKLAEFDAELVKLRLDVLSYQGIERALNDQLAAKEKVIEALESDKKILTERGLRLEENWKKCESDLLEASSPTIWPYIVGAVGAAAGLVGVGIWLGTR